MTTRRAPQNITDQRVRTGPPSKSRRESREFIVTVTTEHYIDVTAADEAHARQIVERRLGTEFGSTRRPAITAVEAVG